MYGYEVILDLKCFDTSQFNRESLGKFLNELCFILEVDPQKRHYWDDEGVAPEERQTNSKTKGTTVIQFLLTSNITIHTLDLLKTVYINIFVCREFDKQKAVDCCLDFFDAEIINCISVVRG